MTRKTRLPWFTPARSAAPAPGPSRQGGVWVITYCDMMTILFACFLCVLSLAARQHAQQSRAGTGLFARDADGRERDAPVWRLRTLTARGGAADSETAPLHCDPGLEPTEQIQQALDDPTLGTLSDSYRLRLPLDMLFQAEGALSPSGKKTLEFLARAVRAFPYDIQFLVEDADKLDQAVTASRHFAMAGAIHPGRIGVGVCGPARDGRWSIWLVYVRNS